MLKRTLGLLAIAFLSVTTTPFCALPTPNDNRNTVRRTEARLHEEEAVSSGEHHGLNTLSDKSLSPLLSKYWKAWLSRDVQVLLELTIELPPELVVVEASRLRTLFAQGPSERELSDPQPYSYWADESNPGLLYVYTTAMVRVDGEWLEDGVVSTWIRMNGCWYVLPRWARIITNSRRNSLPEAEATAKLRGLPDSARQPPGAPAPRP